MANRLLAHFHGGPLDDITVTWNTAQPEAVAMPIPRTIATAHYKLTRKTPTEWHYTEEAHD